MSQREEKLKREQFVLSAACSPDGRRLACGSHDGTVCLFDAESGSLIKALEGHYKPVRGLAFTPGAHPKAWLSTAEAG